MVAHVIRSREEWLHHVSSWQESGLSQAEYSRRHGLKRSSFHKWIHAPSKGSSPSTTSPLPLKIIPVRVKAAYPASDFVLRSPHGWELRLSVGMDAQWVGSVLRALS